MASRSEVKVRRMAAKMGVEVRAGSYGSMDGFEVELYGAPGHMAFDKIGGGHTAITNMGGTGETTKEGIWRLALRDLEQFEPCLPDCECRN